MYNLDKTRRSNRMMLIASTGLFLVTLGLIVFGYRGLSGWLVLLVVFGNLMSALAFRRSISHTAASDTREADVQLPQSPTNTTN